MKKRVIAMLVGGLLAVGSSALAYSIRTTAGTTDVGGRDTFIASARVNSGEGNETAWVNDELDRDDVAFVIKYDMDEMEDGWVWQQAYNDNGLAAAGIYAFYLGGTPDYFLVKTDSSSRDRVSTDHYLFTNSEKPEWAVVSITEDLGIASVTNITAVSHVTEFDDPSNNSTTVPEPGTMMMLGAGCLGLAIYGKRRKNA